MVWYFFSLLIAGVGLHCDFVNSDQSRIKDMMNLNMVSLTELTKLFLPEIKRKSGGILNISSVAGFTGTPNMGVYSSVFSEFVLIS